MLDSTHRLSLKMSVSADIQTFARAKIHLDLVSCFQSLFCYQLIKLLTSQDREALIYCISEVNGPEKRRNNQPDLQGNKAANSMLPG